MEEDVMGPLKEFVGTRYTLCDRCGKPITRREARVAQEGLGEDTLSDFEELCDECQTPQPDEETPAE